MRLLVDLATAFLVLSLSTSVVIAAVHWALRSGIDALPASWRARVGLSALLAPVVVAALGVVIALLPSVWHVIGLASDHCSNAPGHLHAHLCFVHQPAVGSQVLAAVVAAFATILMVRAGLMIGKMWRARRMFMSVVATSASRTLDENVHLLESDVPICATVGVLRPRIYVSSSAAAALGPDCLTAALGHEYGHLRRNETRARAFATFAALFHVPGVDRFFLQRWHEDAEFACDSFAARYAGSGILVAEALVRFQRALLRSGASPICAGACLCDHRSTLAPRILILLTTESEANRTLDSDDGKLAFGLGLAMLLLGVCLQARPLHHALESFVGLLVHVLK